MNSSHARAAASAAGGAGAAPPVASSAATSHSRRPAARFSDWRVAGGGRPALRLRANVVPFAGRAVSCESAIRFTSPLYMPALSRYAAAAARPRYESGAERAVRYEVQEGTSAAGAAAADEAADVALDRVRPPRPPRPPSSRFRRRGGAARRREGGRGAFRRSHSSAPTSVGAPPRHQTATSAAPRAVTQLASRRADRFDVGLSAEAVCVVTCAETLSSRPRPARRDSARSPTPVPAAPEPPPLAESPPAAPGPPAGRRADCTCAQMLSPMRVPSCDGC
ncbi:hypothetical protein EVAR_102738_1 [Eumeta japonica]|uniref:Uncharacterized protein n=1 Tax=Eumeta variegata TaxID=151549 RepID=A0A4C1TKT3_EUMVA|nr:hypothetical protein EVAR_102738_1 [Eumeta japonica]